MAMTVSELAKRACVPAHVVRYYTRAGLLRPARNPANRYQIYRDSDLSRLRFIRRAKLLGFALADISQILGDADRRRSPCPRTRQIIVENMRKNDQRLEALQAVQRRIREAVKLWSRLPDKVPNGESICYLIEAVTDDHEIEDALK